MNHVVIHGLYELPEFGRNAFEREITCFCGLRFSDLDEFQLHFHNVANQLQKYLNKIER